MKRRESVKLLGAAIISAFSFTPETEWVTIASAGRNHMSREYSESALSDMLSGLPGGKVTEWQFDYGIAGLLGVVVDARRTGPLIQAKIRWFKGKKPLGISYACPCGAGIEWKMDGGTMIVTRYQFESLQVTSAGSSFAEATPV